VTTSLERAQQLARDGLPVFPCKNLRGQEGDKHPLNSAGLLRRHD
jgi:hypothetical protein